MNCQAVWFFLLTMFNCTALGIYMIYSSYYLAPSFILMLIALCYWGYMFFLEMSYSGESTVGQGLINDRNTNFMADTLFRYIFVIIIGNALFSYIFRIYHRAIYIPRYAEPSKVIRYMMLNYIYWYSYSILPFACIVDFCCRKRNRTPNPKYDLTITLLFAVILGLLDDSLGIDLGYTSNKLSRVFANIISMGVTYLIYDYLLFKINGGQWYTLYPQGTSTAY